MKKLLLAALLSASIVQVNAANILFDLIGTAGSGLLPGSEPSLTMPSTGSGGEVGAGIFFDDVALTLTVNVAWGSLNGFTDLTSAVGNSHVHGATANNNGNGFTEIAGIVFTLPRVSSTATGGSIATTTAALTAGQTTDLFNGKWYINIHTANNGNGEMRGFLVAVPEPSTVALGAIGGLGLLVLRLRRKP